MTRSRSVPLGSVVSIVASIFVAWGIAAGGGLRLGVASAQPGGRAAAPGDAASYAIGFDMARTAMEALRRDGFEHDNASLVQGFLDAVHGAEPAVSEEDMRAALTRLERDVSTRLAQERLKTDPAFAALAERNAERSAEMIDLMSHRSGAKQIEGGIWRVELLPGKGEPPQITDTVTITFTVRTADGRMVLERVGTETRVADVIEGGRRALVRMSPGARWQICIPSELAFGLGGLAPDIGPNQALLIDCTLERVQR